MQYNNISLWKLSRKIMNYIHIDYSFGGMPPLLFCCSQQPIFFYLPQNNYSLSLPIQPPCSKTALPINQEHPHEPIQTLPLQNAKEPVETCQSLQLLEEAPRSPRNKSQPTPAPQSRYLRGKPQEIRLEYRVQWKNENRNIVPNILNQVLSFLQKPSKSAGLLRRLFARTPHPAQCSPGRFYQYTRKIRESITHFVNQGIFLRFLEIHEPNCQLYSLQEQLFYMGATRTLLLAFLRNQVGLIALTSKRMSQAKRKTHLIARQALVSKFLEVCRNYRA